MSARRLPSWIWVTGLTAAALAAVGALTAQADQGTKPTAAAKPKPSASPLRSASTEKAKPAAVPDGSGTGRRIVYSLKQRRVWLVDAAGNAARTFPVWPGTVSPAPGAYTVSTRRETGTGTDGVDIEHIVYFTVRSGLSIAFSNATDGSSPKPSTGVQTGAIRMSGGDGAALWQFGTAATQVAVVS